MRRRITIVTNNGRGKIEKDTVEKIIPDKEHLNAQIKYPSRTFKNKKKTLYRKRKYKIERED
jgi:hypothetical protein